MLIRFPVAISYYLDDVQLEGVTGNTINVDTFVEIEVSMISSLMPIMERNSKKLKMTAVFCDGKEYHVQLPIETVSRMVQAAQKEMATLRLLTGRN